MLLAQVGEFVETVESLWWWWTMLRWPLLVFVALLVVRFLFIFVVPPGYIGVILRAGQIVRRNLKSRWYFVLPFVHDGRKIYTGIRPLKFEEETRTKDQSFVSAKGSIQYRVLGEKAEEAMFQVDDPDKIILDRVLSALRSAISTRNASECFEHKDEIAHEVIASVQEGLAKLGFVIDAVPMTDVSPHKDVIKSINDVQSAQRATDSERAKAEATMIRVTANARAEAEAAKLRGEGRAQELTAEAAGYRDMLRTMTGNQNLVVDARTAANLAMFYRSMSVKAAFAQSGRASAVILPDDRPMIEEIAQLVPALIAHEAVEGTDDDTDKIHDEKRDAVLLERLQAQLGEQAAELMESLRSASAEAANEVLESVPGPLRKLAERFVNKVAAKVTK